MEKILDLRSDTVTRPTAEMREAMKNAIVGDDILRDDPTVIDSKSSRRRFSEKRRRS